ncbi:MAG TPA: MerR family transcriptional regulator [Candidatus Methylomirabilis sp.]|nr:MerR family transcriptional regulator [Candidatus Methylomirabilis sp.]
MVNLRLLKIGEVARRTGTSLRTVRYYEELNLIRPKVRSRGGFRLYSEDECRRVQLIKNLQLLDFPLAKIKQLFSGRDQAATGNEAAREVLGLLAEQLRETEARIARYREMRRAIRETAGIIHECLGCCRTPAKEVCLHCQNIAARERLPLPLEYLIAAS